MVSGSSNLDLSESFSWTSHEVVVSVDHCMQLISILGHHLVMIELHGLSYEVMRLCRVPWLCVVKYSRGGVASVLYAIFGLEWFSESKPAV